MNTNEKNSDKKNLREKMKIFWKNYKRNWIWVNIGAYQGIVILLWYLFFVGFLNLALTIILTVFYPLAILLAYYGRKSKHKKIITKIVFVGGLGFVFGGILWFFLGYVLIQAPWGPLRILIGDAVLRGRILLLLLPILCVIAAYVMYRIGKKRDWNFPSN